MKTNSIDEYKNQIICGDNCNVLSKIPSDCIDLVVTSPPYDNLRTYGGHTWNFEELAKELTRVIKPGGVIVWVVGDATVNGSETLSSMRQAIYFKDVCGLNVHDTMIWHKPNTFNFGSNNCYKQSYEFMFIFSKGKINNTNLIKDIPTIMAGKDLTGGRKHADGKRDITPVFICSDYRRRDNVWDITVENESNGHPAPFPYSLASDHIQSWSNAGDIVLDPFAGSGTTLKAAKELNRKFIGIEINQEYVEICHKRIAQEVFDFGQIEIKSTEPALL